jgi:hypothetical protein
MPRRKPAFEQTAKKQKPITDQIHQKSMGLLMGDPLTRVKNLAQRAAEWNPQLRMDPVS